MKPLITLVQLKRMLHYTPSTGVFRWKVATRSHGGKVVPGAVAGNSPEGGYVRIGLLGRIYTAHQLAWFYVFGEWSGSPLDHRDHDKSNNRIKNLRKANKSENAQNMVSAVTGSLSGLLGVSFHSRSQRWRARITLDGKEYSLGYFDTPGEAHTSYLKEKALLHPFGEVAR